METPGEVFDREKEWFENKGEGEPEEDFQWASEVLCSDQVQGEESKSKDGQAEREMLDTYVAMVNQTRKPMLKGSQAFFCYGNRTNIYLMVNYGFCFQDNLYDSYHVNVRLDLDTKTAIDPKKLQAYYGKEDNIQTIRLKRDQFNCFLMAYIRDLLQHSYYQGREQKVLLTKAEDLDFEHACLSIYHGFITNLASQKQYTTTIEEDEELLKTSKDNFRLTMALFYRIDRKKLLRSQLELIELLLGIIEAAIDMRKQMQEGTYEKSCNVEYMKLYLSPMPSEKKQVKEIVKNYPRFDNEEDEHWFQFRRISMRQYLKDIY